jgi:hypothetical protein
MCSQQALHQQLSLNHVLLVVMWESSCNFSTPLLATVCPEVQKPAAAVDQSGQTRAAVLGTAVAVNTNKIHLGTIAVLEPRVGGADQPALVIHSIAG